MSRSLTVRDVCAVLLRQGSLLKCGLCHEPILYAEDIEREHVHERALGGDESKENARLSHVGCHAQITNGTPATSAGSSKNRIAKTRGNRAAKFAVNKLAVDKEREPKPRFGWRKRA